MRKTTTVTRSDAIDAVMPLTAGGTEPFQLPRVKGGVFLRAFDTPARAVPYRGADSRSPGDFVLERADGDGAVRLAAVAGSPLEQADSVYVVTAGNTWQEEATVEVWEEEETDGDNAD